MKLKIIFIFILFHFSLLMIGQEKSNIYFISFELQHSRRISNFKVVIELKKLNNETTIHVTSSPMFDNDKTKKLIIDTTYKIKTAEFDKILLLTNKLSNINANKAMIIGEDGTECKIEFGTFGNLVSYKFWSPDYDTKERGLTEFLEICKQIIKIANLKPNEIL